MLLSSYLNFKPMIEQFGMFFLHDLHLDSHSALNEIGSSDNEEVACVMKLDLKWRKQPSHAQHRA